MQKVKIEAFQVIGISIRTTNEGAKAEAEIGQLWQDFMAKDIPSKIPNKLNTNIYSIYTDYESDHRQGYTAVLGCEVSTLEEIPAGMIGLEVAGATYSKSSVRGDLQQGIIVEHWNTIWNQDLNRAYTTDFEVFGEKAQDPRDAEVDFYIALKE